MVLLKRTILLFFLSFLCLGGQSHTPKELISAFEQSYIHESNKYYSKAIESIERVYDAESYEINLRLGWLYYLSKHYEQSKQYYTIATELFPYSEEAKLGIVLPLSKQNKWYEIEKVYKNILTINPKNSTVLYRLGLIYYNRKEYTKSYEYFKNLTDLYPFGYDGLLMYAWCNLQLGKMKEAEILFNKTLMTMPNDASALEGLQYIK